METVLKTRLERFLDLEALRCEKDVSRVLYIERKFDDIISLPSGDLHMTCRVDRVDEMTDGGIMVIDYKTGSVDPMPADISGVDESMLSREFIRDRVRSFQLPLYVYYLQRHFPGRAINSFLYHLRTMSIDKFFKDGRGQDIDQLMTAYLKALDLIIAEIYNPEIPFTDDPVDIK